MGIRTVPAWRTILARPDLVLIASLMMVSLLLFVAGVAFERNSTAGQEGREVPCVQQHEGSGETGEGSEGGGEHGTAACTQHAGEAQSETVLGVNIEDPRLVGAIALGWLALVVGLFRFGRLALQLVTLAAGAQLIFDAAEVARQIGIGHSGIAALAALVGIGHAAVVALAVLVLMGRARPITDALRPMTVRLAGSAPSTPAAPGRAGSPRT